MFASNIYASYGISRPDILFCKLNYPEMYVNSLKNAHNMYTNYWGQSMSKPLGQFSVSKFHD